MPSGLAALLDDIATLARAAAMSVDDVAAASAKASTKAAGVVIDDTAVTPRYVTGLSPERELPIIAKIARGSLRNKLLILLPVALLLSELAPWAIVPLLMVGGTYLCFEGTEKIVHALKPSEDHRKDIAEVTDPKELEDRQVKSAVRTDFILSAEIMAIALSAIEVDGLLQRALVLAVVAVGITAGVYGAVALLVKMDDVGVHLASRSQGGARAVGRGLVAAMPKLLSALSVIGTAAMIWVGGGIIIHGLHEFHLTPIPDWQHDAAHWASEAAGALGGVAGWLVEALVAAIVGLIIGGVIVAILHVVHAARGGHGDEHAAH